MGYYFGANRTTWTFFVIVYTSVAAVIAATVADQRLLISDLGLDVLPDKAKINISLDEYTSALTKFFSSKDDTFEDVPELKIFKLDNSPKSSTIDRSLVKMVFPVPKSSDVVERASLRLLLPPQYDDPQVIEIAINQIVGTRRTRPVQRDTFYLSGNSTKWCEVDVTSAVSSWTREGRNLGLELVCIGCKNNLNPSVAAITALVHTPQRRKKRSLTRGKTDCTARHQKGKGKKKCCRHEMKVTFTKLGFKEMGDIVEPKAYEAGYCQGMCPPNYNFATNHSRIQGLIHQLDKREAKLFRNKTMLVPKTCCAPSKLGDLEILIVNSQQPDKLKVETWKNMKVLECACS